jgi:hypothetical protein
MTVASKRPYKVRGAAASGNRQAGCTGNGRPSFPGFRTDS